MNNVNQWQRLTFPEPALKMAHNYTLAHHLKKPP